MSSYRISSFFYILSVSLLFLHHHLDGLMMMTIIFLWLWWRIFPLDAIMTNDGSFEITKTFLYTCDMRCLCMFFWWRKISEKKTHSREKKTASRDECKKKQSHFFTRYTNNFILCYVFHTHNFYSFFFLLLSLNLLRKKNDTVECWSLIRTQKNNTGWINFQSFQVFYHHLQQRHSLFSYSSMKTG